MNRERDIFRALADPTRGSILERLTGEATVKELTARFSVLQPAVSQHLAALRGAGLVSERHEGRFSYYRVEPAGLRPLVDWLEHHQAFSTDRMRRLKTLLEEMDE